tara:strand:+ start:148 stop:468 length:321 start_codon:yes stop_codon:yes gene_type:complete
MKYQKAILSFFVLNIFSIIFLLYFANLTRDFEKQNYTLIGEIGDLKEQININEIEYSLYNNYNYLQKMQKIYFENTKDIKSDLQKRISFYDFKNKNIEFLHTVGTK